ncbi:MAG: hypothetical protein ABW040_06950 [Microbacteriaceae bacterium]
MRSLAGNPTTVRRVGQNLEQTAESIRTAVDQLRQIASPDSMIGLSISKVRESASNVADEISQAEGRYSETGAALVDYASALEAAQEEAERAISDHEDATARLSSAQSRQSSLRTDQLQLAVAEPDDPRKSENADDLARISGQISGIRGDVDAAQSRYDDAVDAVDSAAQTAMDRIQNVVEGDDLNDSVWDRVAGWLSDLAGFVADAFRAVFEALVALVQAVIEILAAIVLLLAAIIVLGLAIIAAVVLALIALAVLALVLVLAVVLVLVVALIAAGLIMLLLPLLALVVGILLVRVVVFLTMTAALAAIYLLMGRDPMDALVQAAMVSLFTVFPELWAVVGLASLAEMGDPVYGGSESAEFSDEQSFAELMNMNAEIDAAGHLPGSDPSVNDDSVVRVVSFPELDANGNPVLDANGDPVLVYRVHIPSTQQWTPGGTSGNDVTSDIVGKMNPAQQTQLAAMVEDAMVQAGVPDGSRVMLTGWSLGGITAGNLAADPGFQDRYQVDAVVTAGSSLDDMPIPPNTAVLDVSHSQDPVPRTENPFRPDHRGDDNRYHVDVPAPSHPDGNAVGHSSGQYTETMRDEVDSGTNATANEFLEQDGISDYFGQPVDANDYRYNRG